MRVSVGVGDLVAGEARDHGGGDLGIGLAGEGGDLGGGELRPALGHVEAAVAGEAGQHGVGEAEHRRLAAGRDELHWGMARRKVGAT